MKLEAVVDMPCLLSAAWSRFGVHLFHGKITVRDIDEIERIGDEWFARHPGKLVELVIIFPSRARLTTAERLRLSRMIKRREKERTASATVILAEGLIGAAHRSVLTGLMLLAPPPHPAKVFGKTADAIGWLAPRVRALCGESATNESLIAAVDELCASFAPRMRENERAPQ
jgi:hypothetical protein